MSDAGFAGSVLNALPLEKLISAPLNAMISAQISASHQYAEFLLSVCIQNGEAQNVQFKYDEIMTDSMGKSTGSRERTMTIPLIAAISHPNMCIEDGTVDFELRVSSSSEDHSTDEKSGSLNASVGWGPFKVSVHGTMAHKSEQTRKTDTSAKYSIHTHVRRLPPPEALMKVIDFMTEAATKPVISGDMKAAGIEKERVVKIGRRTHHSSPKPNPNN